MPCSPLTCIIGTVPPMCLPHRCNSVSHLAAHIMMAANCMANGAAPHTADDNNDPNAAGQPDTPVELLTALLGKALQCKDAAATRQLVKQAHAIVAGLDPYLDQISTPPSEASDC